MTQGPSGDRNPPPDVPPVVHKGVRYEQDMAGGSDGRGVNSGTLVAYDNKTGKRLWELQVHTVIDHSAAGVETQGRYFGSMVVVRGRQEPELLIVDEIGVCYSIDLVKKSAIRLGRLWLRSGIRPWACRDSACTSPRRSSAHQSSYRSRRTRELSV